MVAKMTFPHSMKRALNYNEKKVQQGKAELVHAGNFIQKPSEMNIHDKLDRFQNLMDLNTRAQTKTLHVSLNVHPADQVDTAKMVQIAEAYMQKIGFGSQPYLVYQHNDAGHQHVHIVSTLIREDGTRINSNNLGRDVSEPARKELEKAHGLVQAESKHLKKEMGLQPIDPHRVHYGKSESLRSITNVLDHVLTKYKYTSLAELNAVLRLYNVEADRGAEGSRLYKNNGLQYRVLDENGQKIGVPIKASIIHNKPTLKYLEPKFKANELKREPDKQRVKTAIEWQIRQRPQSLQAFQRGLQKERVSLVVRQNEQGRIYGMTFIDHERKSVFNGSDLSKAYTAKGILERLGLEPGKQPVREKDVLQNREATKTTSKETTLSRESNPRLQPGEKAAALEKEQPERGNRFTEKDGRDDPGKEAGKLIQKLIEPENSNESLDFHLREEERRRRRRNQDFER